MSKTGVKTLFGILILFSLVIIIVPVMADNAQDTPEEDDTSILPNPNNEDVTITDQDIIEDIKFAISQFQIQNDDLAEFADNGYIQDTIKHSNDTINRLQAQLISDTPTVEISINDVDLPEIDHIREVFGDNENGTWTFDEEDEITDYVGLAIVWIKHQNQRFSEFPDNEHIQNMIRYNNDTVDRLFVKWREEIPPLPTVEISQEDRKKMDDAIWSLIMSGLPVYGFSINDSTGFLDIDVLASEFTPGIEQEIREITGDIDIYIIQLETLPSFQSSCNRTTEYCDPIIGGAKGEDKYWGLDCTISIAAVRNTGTGTENGIVIPDHCNKRTSQYYQADKDVATHLVGSETKDGGWFCDCDFVKSNIRDINTSKVKMNSREDTVLLGKGDLVRNDMVFMYGIASGYGTGEIVDVNTIKIFNGKIFTDLYKIRGFNFTDGDSGAPIVKVSNNKYGGMNIAGGGENGYNYGHDWSFLKNKLDLQ